MGAALRTLPAFCWTNTVKINVHEIEADAKEFAYEEPTDELNSLLGPDSARDFDFPAPMQVAVRYYRAGDELLFDGVLSGQIVGHCARCLDSFILDVGRDFSFVLVPYDPEEAQNEADGDDLNLSFYHGEHIDLSPLMREQVLLALPSRALCSEGCKGLCAQCGANLNTAPCNCETPSDPRLAVLRDLKISH